MPVTTSEFLKRVRDPGYWRGLCPTLSVSREQTAVVAPHYEVGREAIELARTSIIDQGYFHLPSILPRGDLAPLSAGVQAVVSAGLPAPFAIVYDEVWTLLGRLGNLLGPILGRRHSIVPNIWIYHVPEPGNAAGWPKHRDGDAGMAALQPDGRPWILTLWIPFTDVTPDHSCIHLLPSNCDPNLPDHMEDYHIPAQALSAVRTFPVPAGDILGWNSLVLHWGSTSQANAVGPRISLGIYFQSDEFAPYGRKTYDPSLSPGFDERLALVGRMIENYHGLTPYPEFVVRAGIALARLDEAASRVRQAKSGRPD